jgi:hypothetical protein
MGRSMSTAIARPWLWPNTTQMASPVRLEYEHFNSCSVDHVQHFQMDSRYPLAFHFTTVLVLSR